MCAPSPDHVLTFETLEPMSRLQDLGLMCLPVYHHQGWTSTPDMFLRRGLAQRLVRLQQEALAPHGLAWLVFDAWRPREVQAEVYRHYWNDFRAKHPDWSDAQLQRHLVPYVSAPASVDRVPPHSTGGAVDLGLFNLKTGAPVDMGSDFDEFGPAAANNFYELNHDGSAQHSDFRDWRRFLSDVLVSQGIVSDHGEWFHKDYGNEKWARQVGSAVATYGEVVSCQARPDGRIDATFAVDLSAQEMSQRILRLARRSTLAYPSDLAFPQLRPARTLAKQVWSCELAREQAHLD